MYVCMYVCMSVHNEFTSKIYGFMHSLHIFPLMVPLRWRTWWIKDIGRLENKSRDIEDGQLLNNGTKDTRITVTGDRDDLPVST